MEVIKKRFRLNPKIRGYYFKVQLTQNIDDMGMRTDMPLNTADMRDGISSEWYVQGGKISYLTDSKINRLKSYDNLNTFKLNFDINKGVYTNYKLEIIDGVDRITELSDKIIYVLDANRDNKIGTTGQTTGLLYEDNSNDVSLLPEELDENISNTRVDYMSEGWNETNVEFAPQIQEEYLLGIIGKPEVESDVFIDRSTFSVLDKHLRLSEVESLDHLVKYGNGFYKISRD